MKPCIMMYHLPHPSLPPSQSKWLIDFFRQQQLPFAGAYFDDNLYPGMLANADWGTGEHLQPRACLITERLN